MHHATEYILDRPKPLSLYVFTDDKDVAEHFIHHTSSGSICVNDAVVQVSPRCAFQRAMEATCGIYYILTWTFAGLHCRLLHRFLGNKNESKFRHVSCCRAVSYSIAQSVVDTSPIAGMFAAQRGKSITSYQHRATTLRRTLYDAALRR